jgi:hypothetical protein
MKYLLTRELFQALILALLISIILSLIINSVIVLHLDVSGKLKQVLEYLLFSFWNIL